MSTLTWTIPSNILCNTWDRRFITLTSWEVEFVNWPLVIGLAKRFWNSFLSPSKLGFTNWTMQWSAKGNNDGINFNTEKMSWFSGFSSPVENKKKKKPCWFSKRIVSEYWEKNPRSFSPQRKITFRHERSLRGGGVRKIRGYRSRCLLWRDEKRSNLIIRLVWLHLHSIKLFCNGVPVNTIRLLVRIFIAATEIADFSFFNVCPSSQTTRSAPVVIHDQIRRKRMEK